MTVSEVLRAIRKRWWVVVLLIVVGGGSATYLTSKQVERYQSSVTFFVSTPSTNDSAALAADQFASRRVNSYVRLLRSDLLARAIHNAGVDLSTGQIANEIHGSADLNTVLLNATVQDSSKPRALRIARAIADNFETVVSQVDAQAQPTKVDGKSYAVQLKVSSGPTVLASPIYPHKTLNLALGLGLGVLVGVFLVWIRELTDTSVRSLEELLSITSVSALGSVPFDRAAKRTPLLLNGGRNPMRAEAFRKIRTGLQFAGVDTPIQVLAVSSSVAGEGKTTTAINIAVVTAEAGKRVLIIDCDMRRPRVGTYTGLSGAVGLTDVLAGRADVDELVQQWGEHELDVLVCGSLPPNPSELLSSRTMANLISGLRSDYDVIVLDTPPLVPVTDAAVAATFSDGLLLVVRQRSTRRNDVQSALRSLRAVDGRVAGTVLTMVRGGDTDPYTSYAQHQTPRWRAFLPWGRSADLSWPGTGRHAEVERQDLVIGSDATGSGADASETSSNGSRSAGPGGESEPSKRSGRSRSTRRSRATSDSSDKSLPAETPQSARTGHGSP